MLSEEEKKAIEEAISNILRGNDIESATLILEKGILDSLIIVSERVDIIKVATRQILNFVKEYKNKSYLDVVTEKVKADEKITKLQEENKVFKRALDKETADRSNDLLELQKKDKMIDLMAEHIVSSAIVDDTVCAIKCDCETDILEDCTYDKMLNCTKQYFEQKATNDG